MTFLLNFLLAYLLVAAVLFIIYLIAAFAFWEKTKKNICSDPGELLITIAVISLFWVVFLKSFFKGLFSSDV